MKNILVFALLIFFLASCSKHTVEKEIILEQPITLEKQITGVISEDIIKKAQRKYGKFVRNRYEEYNKKLYELQNSSIRMKLEEVNNFYNRVPYVDDSEVWNQSDYWATPLEFLGKDKGDCEDYVIAKYFFLRHLGIESKKLYFSYVKSTRFKRSHMVLSYFETPYSIPLILDSINFKIFPADKRDDLIPVYNFNGETLYHAREKGQNGRKVTNASSNQKVHNKWDRLLYDIKTNKL